MGAFPKNSYVNWDPVGNKYLNDFVTAVTIGRMMFFRSPRSGRRREMSPSLAEFIHRQNMRHYRKEISAGATGPRRSMVLSLMAAEDAMADKQGWPPTPAEER